MSPTGLFLSGGTLQLFNLSPDAVAVPTVPISESISDDVANGFFNIDLISDAVVVVVVVGVTGGRGGSGSDPTDEQVVVIGR